MEVAMKKIVTIAIAGVSVLGALTASVSAEGVSSLRGTNNIDSGAKIYEKKQQLKAEGGFERSWEEQPPTIPHTIDKDRISLRENTCMKCHSEKNFEKEKAPKVGDSHYFTRDGKELKVISSSRYFCNQCHIPQLDAAPLVENTFQGLPSKQ
jgi:cytochrome c-type protein NapB